MLIYCTPSDSCNNICSASTATPRRRFARITGGITISSSATSLSRVYLSFLYNGTSRTLLFFVYYFNSQSDRVLQYSIFNSEPEPINTSFCIPQTSVGFTFSLFGSLKRHAASLPWFVPLVIHTVHNLIHSTSVVQNTYSLI